MRRHVILTILWMVWLEGTFAADPSPAPFVNFETPVVQPLALNPAGDLLAVCNLPAGQVDLFRNSPTGLSPLGPIRVGIDPVSVRFRTDSELWVVNYISRTINIIDTTTLRIQAIIPTDHRPTDVLFAGTPQKAFVAASLANKLQVFSPETHALLAEIPIQGERPTMLARSPDGSTVYVTIKESGNRSTIIARKVVPLHEHSKPGAVDDPGGPYGGQNPPPNSGALFSPPINPQLAPHRPPPTSMIVRKHPNGRWLDDNNGDWTPYISGTNAPMTGRIEGWDMLDHDLARVDANSFATTYVDGLMTMCLGLGVNPATGEISIVGTEARNEIRFEPNLKSIFAKVILARVPAAGPDTSLLDLNPHLDDVTRWLPAAERRKSIGDPRAVLWSQDGSRCYIVGLGSNNLLALDASGQRVAAPLEMPDGPAGLALDSARRRLFVFSRFDLSLSEVDLDALRILKTHPLSDPTPAQIKKGRRLLYNTHETSGLGHLSCATCHVDARLDRLAWDLGDPAGSMIPLTTNANFVGTRNLGPFHPMKGAMITATLQDIIGKEPLHWRGDRTSIEEFGNTFTNLNGAAEEPAAAEMADFRAFLKSIFFPPNPYLNAEGRLSTNVPLPGFIASGKGSLPRGAPLPPGNAVLGRGRTACFACHTTVSGHGTDLFAHVLDERNHALNGHVLESSEMLPFKTSQFRNLYERTGLRYDIPDSTAGFGFLHDGRADRLEFFIQDGADSLEPPTEDQAVADILARLLSSESEGRILGVASPTRGAHGLVGRQFYLSEATLPEFARLAQTTFSRRDVAETIIRGEFPNGPRGWRQDFLTGTFDSDRRYETASTNDFLAMMETNHSLIVMVVHRGTANRLALDWDQDGIYDQDELDLGSDPNDPRSLPANTPPVFTSTPDFVSTAHRTLLQPLRASDPQSPLADPRFELISPPELGAVVESNPGLFRWIPEGRHAGKIHVFQLRLIDPIDPRLSATSEVRVAVQPVLAVTRQNSSLAFEWEVAPDVTVRLDRRQSLDGPWTPQNSLPQGVTSTTLPLNPLPAATEYFRLSTLPSP